MPTKKITLLHRLLHAAERTRGYLHRVVASLAATGTLTGLVVALAGGPKAGYIVAVLCAVLGVSPVVASANTDVGKPADVAPDQD